MERACYRLIFPEDLDHKAVESFVANVGALPCAPLGLPSTGSALVFEVWGDRTGIHHRLKLPQDHTHLVNQLRTHTGGLNVEEDEGLALADFSIATEFGLTSDIAPMQIADSGRVAASLLTSLQPLQSGEVAVIQWVVAPTSRRPPRRRSGGIPLSLGHARGGRDLFTGVAAGIWNVGSAMTRHVTTAASTHAEAREDMRQAQIAQKWQYPMFTAICRIGARSPNGNAGVIHNRIVNALQSASTGGVGFKRRSYGTRERVIEWLQRGTVPVLNWPCLLNAQELSALVAFPIGSPIIAGLNLGGSYQAPPAPDIPVNGRVLAGSTYTGTDRPLAIPWPETLRHVYTVGSTGSGKTTLLENCALQDMQRGVGLVYLDPKGDSAERLINCIPPGRERDVIYFDPTNKSRVVGLNLFAGSTSNPSLTTDNILGMFEKLYSKNGQKWGSRMDDILRHTVRTMAVIPQVTLLEVSEILLNERFRKQMLQRLSLSHALQDFWQQYDAMSADKRAEHLGPLLGRLRSFSVRDEVRHVVGQSGGLNMDDAIAGRKIVIANLAKGKLGDDTAAFFGSMFMLALWQAVQRRPQASRKMPFYCYVDECQDFLNLPTSIGDILAQARGYGFGLTLANQHLWQLGSDLRHDVLANCNSFAYFRLDADDAGVVAKQYGRHMEPDNFMNLGQYKIVASISTGGHMRSKPTVGRTYPEVEETGTKEAILENTKNEYAYSCAKVDEDIEQRREAYSKRPNVGSRPAD